MKYLFSTLLIACVSVLMSAQPKLNLNTGSIDFEWQQEEDGWHISCIKIDGKQIPAPKGYYTVLYIDRKGFYVLSVKSRNASRWYSEIFSQSPFRRR